MNKELPSVEEYKKMIQAADWHYEYAEGTAYRRGEAQVCRIREISAASPEHKAVLVETRATAK